MKTKKPKVRRHWGALKPVTKVKPSAKVYKRKPRTAGGDALHLPVQADYDFDSGGFRY